MNLTDLLAACDDHVRKELSCMPDVDDVTSFDPTTDSPPITAHRWLRVADAVAVVADLKSSTKLGLHKYAQSTAPASTRRLCIRSSTSFTTSVPAGSPSRVTASSGCSGTMRPSRERRAPASRSRPSGP